MPKRRAPARGREAAKAAAAMPSFAPDTSTADGDARVGMCIRLALPEGQAIRSREDLFPEIHPYPTRAPTAARPFLDKFRRKPGSPEYVNSMVEGLGEEIGRTQWEFGRTLIVRASERASVGLPNT